MTFAEELMLDYLQDELIRNPVPFPIDNILSFIYELEKKEVKYMAEDLNKAVKKWVKASDNLADTVNHNFTEFYVNQLREDEQRAKTRVEAEIYKAIGNSTYKNNDNVADIFKKLGIKA